MPGLSQLSAELIYVDDTVGPWTVGALARCQGVIHPDHLTAESFYEVLGGLRLSTDRLFRFLDLSGAADLVSYVRFLLSSLAGLHAGPLPAELAAFANDHPPPVIACVLRHDASRLQLRLTGENLLLDYLDTRAHAPAGRGSPYFEGLRLDPVSWQAAALEALSEYRQVLDSFEPAAPDIPASHLLVLLADINSVLTLRS